MRNQEHCSSRKGTRGFAFAEILVVLGVVSILFALTVPIMAQSKSRGMAVKSLSNIRQMGIGLSLYAASNGDLPPILRGPKEAGEWTFEFGRFEGTDGWFHHRWLYSYAITSFLGDIEVARAPGNRIGEKVVTYAGSKATLSDYHLTHTLYATPEFFDWPTQTGPDQFGGQRLGTISFPSDKGVLFQSSVFHYPQTGPTVGCCVHDLPAPVAFADLSASEHVMRRMPPGILNIYAPTVFDASEDPRDMNGPPVSDTKHGVRGRDRVR